MNRRFSRPSSDWGNGDVGELHFDFVGKEEVSDWEGRMPWKESKDGKFSVKALYLIMEPGNAVPFPSKII